MLDTMRDIGTARMAAEVDTALDLVVVGATGAEAIEDITMVGGKGIALAAEVPNAAMGDDLAIKVANGSSELWRLEEMKLLRLIEF